MLPPTCTIATAAVGAAVLSSFLFGYSICVLDSCSELMAVVLEWCGNDWQADCPESQRRQGTVNALVYLGAALGAFACGTRRVSALGGRLQLVVADGLFLAGALSCGLAPGFAALALGRLASGVGVGVSAIAGPLYIAEVAPRERRGSCCAMNGVLITVGILASVAFGLPQGPPPRGPGDRVVGLDAWFWRSLLGVAALPALAQAALLLGVCPVDPPAQLLQRGRRAEARTLLYRTYGLEPAAAVDMLDPRQAQLELQLGELEESVATAALAPRIGVRQAIGDPFFRFPLFLGFGLAAFQQLCGVNALMSYSNSLFEEAGISPSSLTLASTAMASANVAVSVFSSQVADSWGRRKLLILGALGQTLAMAALVSSGSLLAHDTGGPMAVACFIVFVTSFSTGLGAITWLYLAEIYPMEIRGSALSTCGVINWISCFVVVYCGRFLSLMRACQVFGTISGVGLLGVYLWVVETKGCSMDDSPLTPRSGRSSSALLSPASPRANFEKLEDDEDAALSGSGGA